MKGRIRRSVAASLVKIVTAVFAVGFLFSLSFTFSTFAAANLFKVENVELTELSETAEGSITNFDETSIATNVTFHKLGDIAKYTITLKNSDTKDRTIESISNNNENPYIIYEHDSYADTLVKAGESFDFVVTVKYQNEIEDLSERIQTSGIYFAINYYDGEQDEILIVPNTADDASTTPNAANNTSIVPNTGSGTINKINAIKNNVIIVVILAAGLTVCMILIAKKHKKYLKLIAGLIIVVAALATTTSIKAISIGVNKIAFVGNFNFSDKVAVTYMLGEGEETVAIPYGTNNTKEVPKKAGFTANGWTYENGSQFDSSTEITEDLKLYPKYTPSAIVANFDSNGLSFSNNKTSNVIEFNKNCHEETLKTVSHTSNLDDDGEQIYDDDEGEYLNYSSYTSTNDTVTIPGATSLKVSLKYKIESGYDGLYVFRGTYNGSLSSPNENPDYGQLYTFSDDSGINTETFNIDGDTVTLSFYSDSSENFYGYYAAIEGYDADGNPVGNTTTVCDIDVVSGSYKEPETDDTQVFYGWSFNSSATRADYKNLNDALKAINGELGETVNIYAIWEERETFSIKMHGNGLNFENNSDLNTIKFATDCREVQVPMVKYSHTDNVDDTGNRIRDYSDYLTTKDVITFEGASSLRVTTAYSTESGYDYVYIFAGDYSGNISGGMDDGQIATYDGSHSISDPVTAIVSGDTVTIAFYSDSSNGDYGYYSKIEPLDADGNLITTNQTTTVCERELVAGQYREPVANDLQAFIGWSEDENALSPDYLNEAEVTNNLSGADGESKDLYAIWVKIHTITFDGNGATSGTMQDQKVDGGRQSQLNSNSYYRTNYEFLGWSTDKDATEAEFRNQGTFTAPDNYETTTLYAVWRKKHRLVFDGNGSTSGSMIDYYYSKGSSISLPNNNYTRTNYDFLGWSTNKDATRIEYANRTSFTVPTNSEETIFYAVWRKKHHLIFDGNGATSGSMSDTYYYAPGSSITLPSYNYSRTNYQFIGWSTNKDATEATYANRANFTVPNNSGETTLFAIWRKQHRIIYDGNGATSGSMSDQVVATGATVTLSNNSYAKTNFTFAGWSEDPNATVETYGNKANFIAPTETTETTLYAVWRAKPTVKFDGNGATSGSMADQVFKYDTAANLRYNNFTRTDYSFMGWSEDMDATEPTYQDRDSFTPPRERDVTTLYAVWRKKFVVHYDNNGYGEGTMADSTYSWASATVTLRDNAFVRPKYYVEGWSTDRNATTPMYEDGGIFTLPTDGTLEVTLYAVWKPAYTIVYDGNGADSGEMYDTVDGRTEITNTVGKVGMVTKLYSPNYIKNDYGFIGWSADTDAGERANNTLNKPTIYGPNEYITLTPDLAARADEDRIITLYAVWIPKDTTYTFQTFDKAAFEAANPNTKIIALEDERNHDTYAVIKQADDKWWMVENLRLNLADTNTIIDATNTNNPTSGFLSRVASVKGKGGIHIPLCDDSIASCIDQLSFYEQNIIMSNPSSPNKEWKQINPAVNGYPNGIGYSWYSHGVHYNYYTATAGHYAVSLAGADNAPTGDICPSGWRLPNGSKNSTASGEFASLDKKMFNLSYNYSRTVTFSDSWTKFPLNLVSSGDAMFYSTYSGYKDISNTNRNKAIFLWAGGPSDPHGVGFLENAVTTKYNPSIYPGNSGSDPAYRARPVRCVAQ